MIGKAQSFGAVSVVNAIASGEGATVGVRLKTEAMVEINPDRKGGSSPATSYLARETVKEAIRAMREKPEDFRWSAKTRSEIPPKVGLKSSSSVSVALALATFAAFGETSYDPSEILACSVRASLSSGVSITGALDDAASCLLGGFNLSDNIRNELLSAERADDQLRVVIKVPNSPSRRSSVRLDRLKAFKNVAHSVFEMASNGNCWKAMTLNGLLYSGLLGYPVDYAVRALELGALGAGLSGTGPAVAAVFEGKAGDPRGLAKEWGSDGSRVIWTTLNNQRGGIIGH